MTASLMNPPPSNFFRLSSGQFAERDRIEASREIIGRSLMKMKFELRPGVPFNVDMVFRALPNVMLATGTCSAMDCLRTPDLIEDDGLVLTIPVSGESILHVRGKEIPIGGNTAALTRTADVARCEIQSASEVINFSLPVQQDRSTDRRSRGRHDAADSGRHRGASAIGALRGHVEGR
jgi:hypothetical protein